MIGGNRTMSRLYGVQLHANICKQLKKYNKQPFCLCCSSSSRNPKTIVHKHSNNAQLHKDFHAEMVQFLQNKHLSVFALEKTISIEGLTGRVDCILRENLFKKKLYISSR